MNSLEKNLTNGSVLKNIAYFSLPYLLSYFLQTLYGLADLFIIGQFEGVASTTAVSIGSQVMHMLTVIIVGLAMGSTVCIGQAVGAGDKKRASAAIGNTVTLFMLLSVVITALLLALVRPIVSVMSTPAEAAEGTRAYLTICFIGIPFITAYNIISSIFRGLGDSKSPMIFIAVACAANIALDYIFIGIMGLGPAGAALGTTLSQAISVVFSLTVILRKKSGISLERRDLHPQRDTMGQLLRIGVPVAAQDGLIQIAFIVITVIANRRGLDAAAAVGIVEKIISDAAVNGVGALRAEYRRGEAGARRADAALRDNHRGEFRHHHRAADAVHLRTGGRPVHAGRGCHHARRAVSARLHLGRALRRNTLLLQRVFLRLRPLRDIVYPQHLRNRARAHTGRVPDLEALPRHALPHGTCHRRGFAAVGHHLRHRFCAAQKA